jgi:hypothetical protein
MTPAPEREAYCKVSDPPANASPSEALYSSQVAGSLTLLSASRAREAAGDADASPQRRAIWNTLRLYCVNCVYFELKW